MTAKGDDMSKHQCRKCDATYWVDSNEAITWRIMAGWCERCAKKGETT